MKFIPDPYPAPLRSGGYDPVEKRRRTCSWGIYVGAKGLEPLTFSV